MCRTRRQILAFLGSTLVSKAFAGPPAGGSPATFDVDRVLSTTPGDADCRLEIRRYVAHATVTLFSLPLISKSSVGSGLAVVEEAGGAAGRTLSIQFGAGSDPESARGLNRLGFIQEAVIEEKPGHPSECAWLAIMTTSQEKTLDEARKTLDTHGALVAYSASQGYGRKGKFVSRVERLEFASRYTWRDVMALFENARAAMSAGLTSEGVITEQSSTEQPVTFLYMVRRAMLDERSQTTGCLVFNRKQFQLDTRKEKDPAAAGYFSAKGLVPASGSVIRLNATLTEKGTGERTPFRLWYEAGGKQALPLRFAYQAKSFLRLTFEADVTADTPPIRFAFKTSKEDA